MSSSDANRPTLTERQRAAVEVDGSVAIVAGAGTGKTHTLGQRYLAHLAAGTSPLAIVAVTFTERAADELRARVRREARRRLPSDDPRRDELEAAPIGTIHALCLRICRDHPDAAGVPPDVRILDPLEGSIWTEERLVGALERIPERLFHVLPYERVRDVLGALLKDPYRADQALSVPAERWPGFVAEARAEARARLDSTPHLAEARATLAQLAGPEADAGERARVAALAAFDAAARDDVEAAAAAVHGVKSTVGSAGTWGDDRDRLRAALATIVPAIRDWSRDKLARLELGPIDELLEAALDDLRQAFEQVRNDLARAKRRAGVVDFADLETAALKALNDEAVRDHYRRRWSVLLVDEVQDTSPVQEAILAHLTSFCRTTLVGDPKQSIYGFRGADADVFRRMTGSVVARGGSEVVLDRSFRTHAPLVGRLNDLFRYVMAEAHEPLEAEHGTAPSDAPHLHVWQLDLPKGVPASVVRLAEAHRIADEIRTALAEGRAVRDADAPDGVRPLRPGDVAVLARTWAPLNLLAEILPARGVPAVHTGGGDLLATREGQDGIAALRLLADRHDDVALVALLRGPCFGVADDDLDRLAEMTAARDENGRRPSWWQRLERSDEVWAQRARTLLQRLFDAARREPPSRLLQRLDRSTGWSAVVANLPGGPRRRADLDGFVAFVRDLERDGGDVYGVARRLRRLVLAGIEVDRPALEAEDAVTLTTVHRSKGLEWPFVVVAALDVDGRSDQAALRLRSDMGVALRLDTPETRRAEPALWTILHAADRASEDAERRRLLYVALTRASDFVALSSGGAKGATYGVLEPALDAAEVPIEVREVDPDTIAWPEPPVPGSDRTLVPTKASASEAVPDAAPDEDAVWDLVLERLGPVTPEAADCLVGVREAGAPPPAATLRGRASLEGGRWTLACWDERDGVHPVVRLVEAAAPIGHDRATGRDLRPESGLEEHRIEFDARRPDDVVDRLVRALGLAERQV